MDYNIEIPFEKRPVAGFYDTGSERKLTTDAIDDASST
jgi:hypothetical protein